MLLARLGHDVLLLDRARFPRKKTCGDGLTPRAVDTLARLGLEKKIASLSFKVLSARLYAPSGTVLRASFANSVEPLPPRGYVIQRVYLDDLLRLEAIKAGARFVGGAQVTDFIWDNQRVKGVKVHVDGVEKEVRSFVVVVATGASLHLLKRLGIAPASGVDLFAVRGYWEGVKDIDDALEFHFVRNISPGYSWLFPVSHDVANIGICFYPGRKFPRILPRKMLMELLSSHPYFRKRLENARPMGKIHGYPIRTGFPLQPVTGKGWLIVGEAAGLVNPVTGEGIDLAMESAELAAQVIHQAMGSGNRDGDTLRLYSKKLHSRFRGMFYALRLIRPVALHPQLQEFVVRMARKRPGLKRRIIRINLGLAPAHQVLFPWL